MIDYTHNCANRINVKVALVNPPKYGDSELPTKPFPIGTLILYSILQNMGYDVDLITSNSLDDIYDLFGQTHYDIVGIVCFTRQRHSAFKCAEIIKNINSNTLIVIGGPHVLSLEYKILEKYDFIDYIISGEAEIAFPKLINSFVSQTPIECTDNIYSRHITNTNNIYLPKEYLNNLPFPHYYENYFVDYALYSRGNMYIHADRMAAIQLSRGCDNQCIFCANRAFFGPHKTYGGYYTFKHLEYLYHKHNIRSFDFIDDNFCGSIADASDLCNCIISSEMDIKWRTSCRLDSVSNDILTLMKNAGCQMISFGLESGSQHILDVIGKNISIEQAEYNLDLCKTLDIPIRFSLTMGYEDGEISTLNDTIRFLNYIRPEAIAIYILKVYPGTPLYSKARNEGVISDEWWFSNLDDAPYYEAHMSFDEFNEAKAYMLENINGNIVNSYKETRDDSEFHIKW